MENTVLVPEKNEKGEIYFKRVPRETLPPHTEAKIERKELQDFFLQKIYLELASKNVPLAFATEKFST